MLNSESKIIQRKNIQFKGKEKAHTGEMLRELMMCLRKC